MSDNDETREMFVDLKSGLDRIEGQLDGISGWMITHAKEHAAMRRQRGATTVWGRLVAFYTGFFLFFWPPRHW